MKTSQKLKNRGCLVRGGYGLWPALLLVLFFSIMAPAPSHSSEAGLRDDAGKLIATLADTALKSLTDPDLPAEVRRERVRNLLHTYFDFKAISRWVLGRYWRRATESERERFNTLFEDLMVYSYADRFAKYSGEKLEINKVDVRGEKDALVHSVLQRPNRQKPVDVIWRVRKSKDRTVIVDIMIEGISMGITQQKEYASVIRNNGGKVAGLIGELEKQLAGLNGSVKSN